LVDTLAGFSFLTHFRAITGGVIDMRDLVFFVSLTGVFLTATAIIVDMKRGDS
jgi:ABC-2 type transport system permease protein